MNLSPHFTLAEFTRTSHKVDNNPVGVHLANLKKLAAALEQVRALFNKPIIITSGYRSPALNKLVDGSATSSHCHGLAADFHVQGMTDKEVCEIIAANRIQFDQLIFEQSAKSTWVHFGIGEKMRKQVLSWKAGKGYVNGVKAL